MSRNPNSEGRCAVTKFRSLVEANIISYTAEFVKHSGHDYVRNCWNISTATQYIAVTAGVRVGRETEWGKTV
jgi:hypothetical protein